MIASYMVEIFKFLRFGKRRTKRVIEISKSSIWKRKRKPYIMLNYYAEINSKDGDAFVINIKNSLAFQNP